MSIHSGITKTKNGKSYHPYISDSKKHDQVFTKIVMQEMLAEEDVESHDVIITDIYNKSIIRIYGIPGHGKGEVDHVGGTAKVTIKRMASSGTAFPGADDIADSLIEKYGSSTSPKYVIKVIPEEELESRRKEAKSTQVATIEGSSTLRALVFKPKAPVFRGSTRFCICDRCKEEYGSCGKFSDKLMTIKHFIHLIYEVKRMMVNKVTMKITTLMKFMSAGSF